MTRNLNGGLISPSISAVPSLEPSSTTITSKSDADWVCLVSASRHVRSLSARLKVGITMEISGAIDSLFVGSEKFPVQVHRTR